MKAFMRELCSRRSGFDAWALQVRGAPMPMRWTVSTTREEARELKRAIPADMFVGPLEVVKVRVLVERVG